MATTTFAADMGVTGTRRSVVRSQRFMEWQSELISTRAAYSTRRRFDDSEGVQCNGDKKSNSKRSLGYGGNAKPMESLQAREAEGEDCSQNFHRKNMARKAADFGLKSVMGQSVEGGGDAAIGSRRLDTSVNQWTGKKKQRRRIVQRQSPLPKERVTRASRSKGLEISLPQDSAMGRGTKRLRRAAQRLAQEEPPPPPLKFPKLRLALTREEIQEDWVKITGHKYVGKPRKSTLVQRGLGLCTSLTCPSAIRYLNGI